MSLSRLQTLFFASILLALVTIAGCTGTKPPASNPTPPPAGASGALPGSFITPQDLAAQPGGLETVRVAYLLLMDKFYKPIKSNDLLRAAWDAVIQDVVRQGGSDNGNAPKFSGDRNADFKAFSDSFNAITVGGDKSRYAFTAVGAMARSLADDHTAFLPAEAYKEISLSNGASAPRTLFTTSMRPSGVGYMKLTAFPPGYEKLQYGKTLSEEVDAALGGFESQGVKGWILDLCNDGGGHTETISTIAGRFIANGLQEIDVDSKGQRFEVPVDGHYYPHPHPLAVLINGGSASAAEIAAAALRDYGVARLFGTKTAGAVNGAEIFPLPGQVGLEYTVVQVLAGKTGKPLDKVGVDPDEAVPQQAGKDAPLEAAEAWISGAAAPTASASPAPTSETLSPGQLRAQPSPYEPALSEVPKLPNLRLLGDVGLDTSNQYVIWAPCASDAAGLARSVAARGWQGQYDQFFGNGDPFTYQVGADIYKDAGGATQALHSNDCPQGFQTVSLPVRVGDESIAMKGTGILQGWTLLRWRRGRLVFSAYYYAEPGLESFDPLTQISKSVDGRYTANPLK